MKTRPATKPECPSTPTGPGWMSYGGHRAHNRRMEDYDDTLRHWHNDARTRGIPCYAECGHCEDTLRMANQDWMRDAQAEIAHAAWSLGQTEAGRAWMDAQPKG